MTHHAESAVVPFEDLTLSLQDGIGTIELNRPDKGNTLRLRTMQELCAALDQLSGDPACEVLVLRGGGKHFSAGADFAFLEELTRSAAVDIRSQVYTYFQGAVRRLYHCPQPTLTVVQGACITVGCELSLATDFRVIAEDAFFQESWIKLGLMPPLGGTFMLPRLIGVGRASEMLLQGRPVKAAEALAIGLCSEVVSRETLDSRGRAFARELKASAPLAYRAAKEALRRGLETSMQTEWSANLSMQSILLGSEDFREGLSAVKAKRAPNFRGR